MASIDDAALGALILAVANGDRAAFRTLYEKTSGKLFAIILRMIRNRPLAEDILQDVYLRIWRNAQSFSPQEASALAWLNAIARNRTIDQLRQKSFTPFPGGDEDGDWYEKIPSPRNAEEDLTNVGALRRCLGGIEEPNRSCVLLAYYEGYSREELAERFGKPVNTIKTWLHRSLTALRACLDAAS